MDAALRRTRAPAGTPLYVHLPFCAAKCHYCDFFSVPAEGQDRNANLDALIREAELYAPHAPTTVFIGGGTPSLLSIPELERLFDALQRICAFRESALEVTVECNPESLSRDKARALLDLGANRLSLGFQSLDDATLRLFGRVHDAAQSFRAFEAARSAGVENLNVDLIYAIPDQTAEQWAIDLGRVLALQPDHLSAYNLTFEEDTVFQRWLTQGRIHKEPEEVELAMFASTRAITAERGYEAYEISNFAKPGRRARHNVNYWSNGPYLGLGPSAVSKLDATRGGNVKSVGAYNRRMREADEAWVWSETPSAEQRLAETWWLGLRLADGISCSDAAQRAGCEPTSDFFAPVLNRLIADGLLTLESQRYRLSPRGLTLADYVARRFLTHDAQ